MVGLTELPDRKPAALSGGQQQRVALARVLVTKPKALLLDEPLGDLDRLLQLRMRVELRNLQRQLGLMFIHVTHNQEEALSMADRIVVMNEARIQQVADPLTIATRPATELVARFMGDNNIIRGKVTESAERPRRDRGRGARARQRPRLQAARRRPSASRRWSRSAPRPSRSARPATAHAGNSAECEIVFVEFLGDLVKLHLIAGGERMLAKVPGERYPDSPGQGGRDDPHLLEGGGCPAPPLLSGPEPVPRLDLADIEADERGGRGRARARARRPASGGARRDAVSGWVTFAWALPGFIWLGFYLIAPLVFIVLMSFWTPDTSKGFVKDWTLHNYGQLLHPFSLNNAYWKDMLRSSQISAIAVAACLVFGFPVAYFLAMKVKKLQYQIALFILALAPFWTSFITRSVAWAYPLMGSHGALNQFLVKIGVSSYDHPLLDTQFTQLSVQLAMIQLYILFMVTPIFFLLAQVDRHALEAARDLGGNWWSTFREVILPQTMPGIVIGSIFIFVLTMGEYGTVEVISQGAVTTVGVYVHSQIVGTQYPQGAASAVLLVFVLILGVFGITRFANLREEI